MIDSSILQAMGNMDKLENLSPHTREALHKIAVVRAYQAGEIILREGDRTREIYMVVNGGVTLFRPKAAGVEESAIAELEAGACFGEMALLDGGARSLSARAKGESRLLVISPDDFLALPGGREMFDELKLAFGIAAVRRMRKATDSYVQALERDLEAARTQRMFGQFFIYTMGVICMGMMINNIVARNIVNVDIYTESFAWQYLLVLLLPSLVVIRNMGIPMSDLGLACQGARRALTEGALVAAVGVASIAGIASAVRHFGELPGEPTAIGFASAITYLLHSFLQELIARGFLQNSFQRFLNDTKGIRSVFLTAILFGLIHLSFGLQVATVTVANSIAFGVFYLRNKNLAGVTLIHFAIGYTVLVTGLN